MTYQNGPISVTQTARIRSILAAITEIWSDQFPHANIGDYANHLPGGAGLVGNARQLMIMGARADNSAYLKANVVTQPSNQEALNHVLVRFQLGDPTSYGPNQNPNPPFGGCNAGAACVNGSIFSLSTAYSPLQMDDSDYSVVVGVDTTGVGQASGSLTAQGISATGTFNLPCPVAPLSLLAPCEGGAGRIVSPATYSLYQTTAPGAGAFASYLGLPVADTFLSAFVEPETPASAAVGAPDPPTNPPNPNQVTLAPTQAPVLYFNSGVTFTAPNTTAINFYNFPEHGDRRDVTLATALAEIRGSVGRRPLAVWSGGRLFRAPGGAVDLVPGRRRSPHRRAGGRCACFVESPRRPKRVQQIPDTRATRSRSTTLAIAAYRATRRPIRSGRRRWTTGRLRVARPIRRARG